MKCPKCDCDMVDSADYGYSTLDIWSIKQLRCIFCGERVDSQIEENRVTPPKIKTRKKYGTP